MKTAAVIPTIDEAETIGDLVRALDKTCDRVIVADASKRDGWTLMSETAYRSESAGALCLAAYPGFDAAYRRGWGPVDKDWHVLHIDAGGSHDPAEVCWMQELAEDGCDVVIGSRFVADGMHLGSWHRKVTSRLASFAMNLAWEWSWSWWEPLGGRPSDIADWTSGYRLYSPRARAVLEAHDFTVSGHAWQIESLFVLRQAGCRIVEHGIVYRPSASHLSRGRVIEAAKLWWRLLWS